MNAAANTDEKNIRGGVVGVAGFSCDVSGWARSEKESHCYNSINCIYRCGFYDMV